jgi:hypothetical protein
MAAGRLLVDVESGVITYTSGRRAENPQSSGYGRVYVGRVNGKVKWCGAHRIVWMARYGPIPPNLVVNHRNRRPWDNRIENLDLTDRAGNVRHAFGWGYAHVPPGMVVDCNAAALERLRVCEGPANEPDEPAAPYVSNWLTDVVSGRRYES